MNLLRLAFSFLTILPVRLREPPQPGDLGRAAAWYPWIGLVIGGLVALLYTGLNWVLAPLLAAALSIAGWAALTGGLHLDGLADCYDGLTNASSPERRLEIMHDPRLGTFGGAGLFLHLMLKTFALLSLPLSTAPLAILLAAVTGRWLILLAGNQPTARPGGLGADFKLGFNTRALLGAAVIPAVLLALTGWRGLLAFGLAHLTAFGIFQLARRRLGGLTGDVFGLTVETAELVVLVAFCLRLPF